MTDNISCDVLVVRAGPTGLMAANCLQRAGVNVRIVEKRLEPSAESRAGIMSTRSVELFASLGASDPLFARGVVTTDFDIYVSGKQAGGLRFDQADAKDTPYKFALMIAQSETERVLIDDLAGLGIAVDRGIDVQSFEQDAREVRLNRHREDGTPVTLRAHWVIGADGAHSILRKAQGVSFGGGEYKQNFLLGDVKVHWPLDNFALRVFFHGDSIGMFVPLFCERSQRVIIIDLRTPPADHDETAPLELDTIQEAFRAATCMDVTLSDPIWLTQFRTHHRVVDRYRIGRTFLAGDAAHIHSPAGGQGMNTGLQDAANLAWKLARVIRHGADEALLDTYQTERLPVARDVVKFTDLLFSTGAGMTGWEGRLRDLLAPVLIKAGTGLDFLQDFAFRKAEQLDITYPRGRFVDGSEKTVDGPYSASPGCRAPEARISRARSVFDLIAGYRFTLMALSRQRLSQADVDALVAEMANVPEECARRLVARLTFGRHPEVESVETIEVFERYGLEGPSDQALVLIRPDGFIAWRSENLDFAGALEFLSDRIAMRAS